MDFQGVGSNSERFLRAMLRFSNFPIVITDARTPDNPIAYVNPAFEKLTGYSAAEAIGRNCRLLQNRDRNQPGRAIVTHAIQNGTSCEALFRNYRKDGSLFWSRLYLFPVADENDAVSHFVGIQHDVTAETTPVHSLKEKQAFIDTSPDIYIKLSLDMKIIQAGGACEAITGWPAPELIGASATVLIPPERLADAKVQFRELLSQEKPSGFTAEYKAKSGNRVMIEWSVARSEERDYVFLVGRDTTEKRAAERETSSANTRIASILSSITEGFYSLDRDWVCTYMNSRAGKWLNRAPEEIIGKNIWSEFPEAVGGTFYETFHQALREQHVCQCEAFYLPVGRWLEARAYPSEDGLTIFFHDISERKENELALFYAATHDPLTGLPNRSACLETLTQRLSSGEDGVATIFIDLDHFKEINDAFGHAAGDDVLKEIGRRLQCFASQTCYPARISGDEFVFILFGTDEAHVRRLGQQILDNISAPIAVKGRELTLGASIGIALSRGGMTTADELINQADTAMYASKSNGRHSLTIFDHDVSNWNLMRHRLRQDMLLAIHSGQFVLHYQPQVSLIGNAVIGAEALVRWQHPEFGLLSPAAFLEIAEESPLIIELGAWVFDEACRQLRGWQDQGKSLTMSINVSARQLANHNLPEMMTQAILRHRVSPNCIKLEVTESMLAQDFDAASQVLASLKQKGFRIALDDFGTGYSNLSYISRLPVTAIKIDRSFVTGLAVDKAALPLIKAIVALAKSLDLTVICEGIETPEQRQMLETTQCDSIQGYLISKPLPAHAFASTCLGLQVT